MTDFMIHFLLRSVLVSGVIGIFLAVRQIFGKHLLARTRYRMWFGLLALLAVPFLPLHLSGSFVQIPQFFFQNVCSISAPAAGADTSAAAGSLNAAEWMEEFALSVSQRTPNVLGLLLYGIWTAGILVMNIWMLHCALRLAALKSSALPLQNRNVRHLYQDCLKELGIRKDIPICSTAFLGAPIIAGIRKPCIYLPIGLLSDEQLPSMRYLLLHELFHYRHKDLLVNALLNLVRTLYWFHPLVWYVCRQIRADQETACDASVLEQNREETWNDYARALIHLAGHRQPAPFSFAAGLTGSRSRLEQRVLHILAYQRPTLARRRKNRAVSALTAVLLLLSAPFLSVRAADPDRYEWPGAHANVTLMDLSGHFGSYEGSFVLYSLQQDAWYIHDLDHALLRTSPDSTYKIYDALFGLADGVITPEASLIPWDRTVYPYDAWNRDQTLRSAMQASVNWYFQNIDRKLGIRRVRQQIEALGYGNQNTSGGLSCWLESSLKISPVEQTELLVRLYRGELAFPPEQIRAVQDALLLTSDGTSSLYGKTGTGRIDGHDENGWFIGYLETADDTYFFAVNIRAAEDASGSRAAALTLEILPHLLPSSGTSSFRSFR